jgi:hypothetical protein
MRMIGSAGGVGNQGRQGCWHQGGLDQGRECHDNHTSQDVCGSYGRGGCGFAAGRATGGAQFHQTTDFSSQMTY